MSIFCYDCSPHGVSTSLPYEQEFLRVLNSNRPISQVPSMLKSTWTVQIEGQRKSYHALLSPRGIMTCALERAFGKKVHESHPAAEMEELRQAHDIPFR